MTTPGLPLMLTIGYGKRSIDATIDLLHQHSVRYLIDVRSAPYSRYRPEFSHDALRERLGAEGIAYLYMGRELGGRPDDPSCYDAKGRVDYAACRARAEFGQGIGRLVNAWTGGHRVALLCSEARPEECHRSKLLGPALQERGVVVSHVDEDDTIVGQDDVMARLAKGQLTLFEDVPAPKAARSRSRVRKAEE